MCITPVVICSTKMLLLLAKIIEGASSVELESHNRRKKADDVIKEMKKVFENFLQKNSQLFLDVCRD